MRSEAPVPALASEARGRLLLGVAAAGFLVSVLGWVVDREAAAGGLLVAARYGLGLAVGGLLFVVFTSVTRAGWSVAIRRIPEALMLALPAAGAFLLVALLLALPVYEWMYADGDPLLEHKAAWLNPVGVVARAAIALLVWQYRRGGRRT